MSHPEASCQRRRPSFRIKSITWTSLQGLQSALQWWSQSSSPQNTQTWATRTQSTLPYKWLKTETPSTQSTLTLYTTQTSRTQSVPSTKNNFQTVNRGTLPSSSTTESSTNWLCKWQISKSLSGERSTSTDRTLIFRSNTCTETWLSRSKGKIFKTLSSIRRRQFISIDNKYIFNVNLIW